MARRRSRSRGRGKSPQLSVVIGVLLWVIGVYALYIGTPMVSRSMGTTALAMSAVVLLFGIYYRA